MQTEQTIALVQNALEDMKAKEIVVLDVQGRSTVTDYMIIASGTSRRHVLSVAEEVVVQVKQAGLMPLGTEGQEAGDWVLVDLGDVVVHVMMPDARSFYDLERLWGVETAAAK
ncbi:ribosome silencing factor [Neptuniibacter sp. CAU 1671]|uniref:ribosome silencing factor n=1 Tax=Neptuniibacter sp. CAU 1671 TaxID=3032593 RepID=UPI0023DC86A6|nr:ribosome silencing factor [Neptuniibacter sp. CAU 1671]MDF2181713.1 ribosome silencing factor [Neptuniibacter sp. CAU 1671]